MEPNNFKFDIPAGYFVSSMQEKFGATKITSAECYSKNKLGILKKHPVD